MSTITLNQDQEEASKKIIDFIEGRLDLPYFTLTGGPGTGKSLMLKETLSRTPTYSFDRSAAAIAHAAKNVLDNFFDSSIPCYTVAQWLGQKMKYTEDGEVVFIKDPKGIPKLSTTRLALLDEASMINDDTYDTIMNIVQQHNIKLIAIGDKFQLGPVKQNHDSKFFDKIDAELTIPMRFTGPIDDLVGIYRKEITDINHGYAGNRYALNEKTNRKSVYDAELQSGYAFNNDIYALVEQAASEIRDNPENINFSRVLGFKNATIDLVNKEIRKYIYGNHCNQFEQGEIVISRGGFSVDKSPIIHNGKILKIEDFCDIPGPYGVPCLSMKFKDYNTKENVVIVKSNTEALNIYNSLKNKYLENAKRDPKQWVNYYNFIDSFAYFDYAYSVNAYRSQGQTLNNVYVLENEIMSVKPLSLKQKFQALYVAMTRASKNLYIYNKEF